MSGIGAASSCSPKLSPAVLAALQASVWGSQQLVLWSPPAAPACVVHSRAKKAPPLTRAS